MREEIYHSYLHQIHVYTSALIDAETTCHIRYVVINTQEILHWLYIITPHTHVQQGKSNRSRLLSSTLLLLLSWTQKPPDLE